MAIKDILELLSYLATVLGIPIAIYLFYHEKRRERISREIEAYSATHETYLEYLKLCLDNIDLDVFDIPDEHPVALSAEQKKRELIVFCMLIGIFERAFLMYKDQSTYIKKKQWSGWNNYMIDWSSRKNFRKDWAILRGQFDIEFVEHMDRLIMDATDRSPATKTSPDQSSPDFSTASAPYRDLSPSVTSPTLTTATATMSPWRTSAARSGVREWQMVTMACSWSSSSAIGLPTTFERPTTTAFRPASGTP